jgi:hypothetical protein
VDCVNGDQGGRLKGALAITSVEHGGPLDIPADAVLADPPVPIQDRLRAEQPEVEQMLDDWNPIPPDRVIRRGRNPSERIIEMNHIWSETLHERPDLSRALNVPNRGSADYDSRFLLQVDIRSDELLHAMAMAA